jgi:hypothetical protein
MGPTGELREVIFKFVEENEEPYGDTVVDITLGMFDPGC